MQHVFDLSSARAGLKSDFALRSSAFFRLLVFGFQISRRLLPGAACLCLISGVLGAGCKSSSPAADKQAAAPFASVEIRGNTPGQISKMTQAVFREHGYLVPRAGLTNLLFEKKGSKLSNFAYGNWMSDSSVWVRVKVSIVPVSEADYRLQCHAYDVLDRGVAIEEESKMSHLRNGPYQKLLEEVAKRLQGEG